MKKIFILLIIGCLLSSCGETRVELSIEKLKTTDDGMLVKGITNFPDNTRLIVRTIRDKNVSSQDSNIIVLNGKFQAFLNESISSNLIYEVSCIANERIQNKKVLEKLKFYKSKLWTEETTGPVYTYRQILKAPRYMELWQDELIGYPVWTTVRNTELEGINLDYTFIGEMSGKVRDTLALNVKKISTDIRYLTKLNNEILERDLRHFIFKILEKDKDVKVICLQCFLESENKPFQSRIFIIDTDS